MAQYPSLLAVSDTGQVLQLAAGEIYDVDDLTASNPLQITDLSGAPISGSILQSAPNGVLPRFRENSTRTVVSWVSGPHRMDIPCLDIIPPGGEPGQILTLDASRNLVWAASPSGGGGGGIGNVMYVTGNSNVQRPTTLTSVMVIFLTTGTTPPANMLPNLDLWVQQS